MNAQFYPALHSKTESRVALVFLHGFLGSGADWQAIVSHFSDYPRLTVDLIASEKADTDLRGVTFADLLRELADTIHHALPRAITNLILMGYSLGGRLALHLICASVLEREVIGLVLESAHTGLTNEEERKARRMSDTTWAQRFRNESTRDVLKDWYRQEVFSDLSDQERLVRIEKRAGNDGKAIAALLEIASLGAVPDLSNAIKSTARSIPFLYLVGERDNRYKKLAQTMNLPHRVISNAGHDTHTEQPEMFCRELREFLNHLPRSFSGEPLRKGVMPCS